MVNASKKEVRWYMNVLYAENFYHLTKINFLLYLLSHLRDLHQDTQCMVAAEESWWQLVLI